MIFLITRPDYEPATKYLSSWSEEIIKTARNKGKTVIDLKGEKANKQEFIGRISKLDPRFVMLNGHGSEESIAGQDHEILVRAGDNETILHSRLIYAVSCSSGKILGPKCVEKGNGTFIGYSDMFIFVYDRKYMSRPLDDKRAAPFMEGSNHVAVSLLKGHNAEEASKRSREMFERSYKKLLSSNSDSNSLQTAKYLRWNMKHQVCLGNGNATI